MKILHLSDLHYGPKKLEEADRCTRYAVRYARDNPIDAWMITGDLFDHRIELHHPAVYDLVRVVRQLGDIAPGIILKGTDSHDFAGSLNIFKHIQSTHRIVVADSIQQFLLLANGQWARSTEPAFTEIRTMAPQAVALFSALPSINKAHVAAAVGSEKTATEAGEHVGRLLRSWAPMNRQANERGIPTVFMGHGTVNGCQTEHDVPMAGLDHEFSLGALFASEARAIALGHIHKYQVWPQSSQTVAYPGSIGRYHFGERGPKGFIVWHFDGVTEHSFHQTPSTETLDIDFAGPPDVDKIQAVVNTQDLENTRVRVIYRIDEEHAHEVDHRVIESMLKGAKDVKIDGKILYIQRQRAEGISQLATLEEQMVMWAKTVDLNPEPLGDCLKALETSDRETIVNNIIGGAA